MRPGHGFDPLDSSDSPVKLTLVTTSNSMISGQTINFDLEADEGVTFKGFLIQVRNENDEPIGTFDTTRGRGVTKVMTCDNGSGRGNSLTHL